MEVRVENAAYQVTIHERRSAPAPAICGAPPGSPWTTRRGYVTCGPCLAPRKMHLRSTMKRSRDQGPGQ
jgi:hypothetical protein